MTDTQQRLYTADELLAMPDDGKRRELIRGALLEMSPTNALHGVLANELSRLIGNHVRAHKLGQVFAAETGFTLFRNPDTTLAPDVAFISAERAKPLTEKFSTIAPDQAVEVVSPGNNAAEMNEKIALYFQAGSRQVWLVYPKTRTIHVYSAANQVTISGIEDTLDASAVLPGFTLLLETLFSVLDS